MRASTRASIYYSADVLAKKSLPRKCHNVSSAGQCDVEHRKEDEVCDSTGGWVVGLRKNILNTCSQVHGSVHTAGTGVRELCDLVRSPCLQRITRKYVDLT